MDLSVALMGLAIHILFWEKLPDWGSWFNKLIAALPRPLGALYEGWRCPYCFGFWVALALHGLTGLQTLVVLTSMPEYIGVFGTPLAWLLDALASAVLIMFAHLVLSAISGPAIKGHQLKQEFEASFSDKETH